MTASVQSPSLIPGELERVARWLEAGDRARDLYWQRQRQPGARNVGPRPSTRPWGVRRMPKTFHVVHGDGAHLGPAFHSRGAALKHLRKVARVHPDAWILIRVRRRLS